MRPETSTATFKGTATTWVVGRTRFFDTIEISNSMIHMRSPFKILLELPRESVSHVEVQTVTVRARATYFRFRTTDGQLESLWFALVYSTPVIIALIDRGWPIVELPPDTKRARLKSIRQKISNYLQT